MRLDDDLLAAYVEGRLSPEERDVVEAGLVHDAEARALVGRLRAVLPDTATDVPTPALPRRRHYLPLAAAAVLLLAAGAVWLLLGGPDRPPQNSVERLLARADDLAAEDPERFNGLRAAVAETGPLVTLRVDRGGMQVVAPYGEVLDGRPVLRWQAVAGAKRYTLRVATESGADARTFEAEASPFTWPTDAPPLVAGTRYLFEVRTRGPFGEHTAASLFRVADENARAEQAAAEAAVRAVADGDEAALLLAFQALSRERYAVARTALHELEARLPEDARVRHLRSRLGPLAD